MASSNLYLDSIVPILNDKKKIGIGFVVKEDADYSWLLTCQHVVHDGSEYKNKLTIRDGSSDGFESQIDTSKIVLADGIDLALVPVKRLEDKKVYLLHEHVNDDTLTISTYSNICQVSPRCSSFFKFID